MPDLGNISQNPTPNFTAFMHELAPDAEGVEGLATLRQLTQEVMSDGYITPEERELIDRTTNPNSPQISKPDLEQLQDFVERTEAQPPSSAGPSGLSGGPGPSGPPGPIPVGKNNNIWLNNDSMVELFKITTEVCMAMSKIQLAENLKKIDMMAMKRDLLIATVKITVLLGEIEAAKEILQANKAWADMGIAIASLAMTVFMFAVTKAYEIREVSKAQNNQPYQTDTGKIDGKVLTTPRTDGLPRVEEKYDKVVGKFVPTPAVDAEGHAIRDASGGLTYTPLREPLDLKTRTDIAAAANRTTAMAEKTIDGIWPIARAALEAGLHTALAGKAIEEAQARAMEKMLSGLSDIINDSMSTLSQGANGLTQLMDSLRELYQRRAQISGEMGRG